MSIVLNISIAEIVAASIMTANTTGPGNAAASSDVIRSLWGLELHSWEQLMLGSLGLAGVIAIAVFITTACVVILTRAENERTKREYEAYKLTVDGRVADAKREGIEAGRTAGDALVRAAQLEKQSAELRASNLILEAQIAPRRLTEAKIALIVADLSSFSGKTVSVTTYSLDSEAAVLAQQITGALRSAHMDVQDQTASIMPMGGFALGVHVSGPDTLLADSIRLALQNRGGLIVAPPNSPQGGGASIGTGPPVGQRNPDALILVGVKPITR